MPESKTHLAYRLRLLSENLPMLRINERLGFTRYADWMIQYTY